MSYRDIQDSFEILISSIETEISEIKQKLLKELDKEFGDNSESYIKEIKRLKNLSSSAKSLLNNFKSKSTERKNIGKSLTHRNRLKKGIKTPVYFYKNILLEVLAQIKNKIKLTEVEKIVFNKIKDQLKPADFEKTTNNREPRWKNTLHWARLKLVKEGYMKNEERGYWEISSKGTEFIKAGNKF